MVEYNRGKRFNHAHPIRYSKLNKLSRFCIALYPIHPPFCTCQVVQWQKSKRRWICESTLYVEWRCAFVLCLLESWNLASGDDVYTNIQNVEIALQVGTLHTHVRERYVSHITRGILSAIFFLLFKLVCMWWPFMESTTIKRWFPTLFQCKIVIWAHHSGCENKLRVV